jgi:hypothetical protein
MREIARQAASPQVNLRVDDLHCIPLPSCLRIG